jgi:aminopeptidase N
MKLISTFFLFIAFFVSPQIFGENKTFNRERTYDVQHYLMRLNFDRSKKIVYGDATIDLKPLTRDFSILELDAEGLNFEFIRSEKSGKNLEFTNTKGKLRIVLDRAYDAEETVSIRLKYSVTKPKKGIYFVDARKKNGKIERAAQVWTQGESEETHHWLPSFDFPDDKATTEQLITVENGETAIGNGELLTTIDHPNGTKTFHYKMPVPHSLYLTSFVIGKYEKISDKYKDVTLGYYVYPGQQTLVPKAYGKTKDMFHVFEELTGVDYPYNKYDQTIVANFQFGGMENITATTMADSEISLAKIPFMQGAVEDLVAHELAHSWFGNLVTCRNWAELWLNEGFATFMEAAFREQMYGRKDYLRKIESDVDQYLVYAAINENKEHGLFNRTADPQNDSTMFTEVTYNKGSAVIHTLRAEIGEEAFWKGVNLYLTRHRFANVETSDMQKIFEETSGKNLDWFFKQWVYGNKYPDLDIKQVYDRNSGELVLTVTQTQTGNEITPEVFKLALDVEVTMPKSKKTDRIEIDQREQVFRIAVDEKPSLVAFDKGYKIPLKDINLSKLSITPTR